MRFEGRILFLTKDPELLAKQLAGEDLGFIPKPEELIDNISTDYRTGNPELVLKHNGDAIKRAQAAGDPDRGDTYYLHVLDALEHLLAENDFLSRESLRQRKSEWEAAYKRTPHGQPVEL